VSVARLLVFSLALSSATLLLLACNSGTAKPQLVPPARTQDQGTVIPLDGARIFQNYCASCHGVNGNGDGPVAPALKAKVPLLTTLAQRNGGMFPADRLRRIIAGDDVSATHGSREMPIWGPIFHQVEYDQDLGYVRLQNVTEYLNTIQQK
jgi:mono/diheme cytochrome c family protein